MKDQLIGCALLLFLAALAFAWWVPQSHTLFWLILIGGIALWFGVRALSAIFDRPDTTLGSAQFGSRADVRLLATSDGDLLIGRSARTGQLLRHGQARASARSSPTC